MTYTDPTPQTRDALLDFLRNGTPIPDPATPAADPAATAAPTAPTVAASGYLGRIAFVTVHEGIIDHARVERILDDLDLGKYTPKRPSDSDTYRKTTTAANRLRKVDVGGGVFANVLVRQVNDDDDEVLRRLVIEEVNAKGKRLRYNETFDLRFDRATSRFEVIDCGHSLSDEVRTLAEDTARDIRDQYHAQRGTVDATGLRSAITKVLASVHAIGLRTTGGAYFVPEVDADTVDRLERLSAAVSTVDIIEIPLPDDPKRRGIVAKALTDSVTGDCDRMAAELADVLGSGEKVSKRRLRTLTAQHAEVTERAETYKALLSKSQGEMETRLMMLGQQMLTALATA